MKKTLKTIVPLLVLTGALTSCTYYSVKPGPKENVIGTYELVKYEMNKVDENGEEIKDNDGNNIRYDRKAELGAVAYFSVADDGYAYYVYKDKNTAPKFATMFASFELNTTEEKNQDYIRSVKLTDGVTSIKEKDKYVGCFDEPSMGFRNDLLKKTLHYNLSGYQDPFTQKIKIPYQYVQYKRVSSEASLAKVNELMGTSFTVDVPYECKAMSGYLVYRCNVNSTEMPLDGKGLYEYAVLDANSYSNGNYTVYYSLKENPGRQVAQIPVTIETKGHSFSTLFAGSKFYGGSEYGTLATTLETKMDEYPEGSLINSESFTHWWSDDLSLEEVIAQETAYNSGI